MCDKLCYVIKSQHKCISLPLAWYNYRTNQGRCGRSFKFASCECYTELIIQEEETYIGFNIYVK